MDTQPLADLLARRLVEEGHSLEGPIAMAELQQRLIPYRLCRAELRFATKAEYDLALLHLLGDEKQAEIQEERLGEAIRSELLSAEPALRFLRRFAASEVKLKVPNGRSSNSGAPVDPTNGTGSVQGPRLHRKASGAPETSTRGKGQWPPPDQTEVPVETDSAAEVAGAAAQAAPPNATKQSAPQRAHRTTRRQPSTKRGPAPAAVAQSCRSCPEELPDVADLRFCPHCGTDQNRWDCSECQTEIQRPWQFCPKCGATQSGG